MRKLSTLTAALLVATGLAATPSLAAQANDNDAFYTADTTAPTAIKAGGYFKYGFNGLRYGRDGNGVKHHRHLRGHEPHGGAYAQRHRGHEHRKYGRHNHKSHHDAHKSGKFGIFLKPKSH